MNDCSENKKPNIRYLSYDGNKVSDRYKVVGVVYMKNGCCAEQPVLITANYHPYTESNVNYSCQCGCGMWCTTGHPTPVGALKDYETMSNNGKPVEDNYDSREHIE